MPPLVSAPSAWTVLPFVAMLLAIALGPLVAPRAWESNTAKLVVAAVLGAPVLILYLVTRPSALVGMAEEYVSFIVLLGGLYAISGGIVLRGDLVATPMTNAAFLAVGAVLASFIGTTGASMLLVRPLLQTNSERGRVRHVFVFFIFIVSNIGGMLTPLGDPPLFLGYLQGVPFTWTFRLGAPWLAMVGALLVVFFVWDTMEYSREPLRRIARDRAELEPLRLRGGGNIALLVTVVLAVAFLRAPWRELAIVLLAIVSVVATPHALHRANRVTAYPMIEVAVLFFGIFLTMIPALDILHARGHELPIRHAWQFFWASGLLSSFLDNAPTYLTFLALAQGLGLAPEVVGVPHGVLTAISVGSVAMGANSYIGNAPNFMVKSIAEAAGVRMPSFFGYLLYSGAILIPLFVVITGLFFR